MKQTLRVFSMQSVACARVHMDVYPRTHLYIYWTLSSWDGTTLAGMQFLVPSAGLPHPGRQLADAHAIQVPNGPHI